MRNYAAMTTLVVTKLQSAGTMDFSVNEVDYAVEEGLKEFSTYKPHIVPIIFKIESRYGTDVTAAASSLTDLVKKQFVATDDDNEKVVHNTTQNTYSTVKTAGTSTTVLTLNTSLMTANDSYNMYNKKCWNNKQIYIGDVLPLINDIESVEYPIGEKRNWKILSEGVLEIDVDYVPDSNANTTVVTSLPNVDVLVRFYRPHILNSMSTLTGTVAGTVGVAGASTISVTLAASAMTVEEGSEVNFATHKQAYIVTTNAVSSSASVAALTIYPPFEAAVGSAAAVTFIKSTLNPEEEEIFADLVASRLAINKAPKYFNAISLGGGSVWQNFLTWGERRLGEVLSKLRRLTPPKTKSTYPKDYLVLRIEMNENTFIKPDHSPEKSFLPSDLEGCPIQWRDGLRL